jgi:hypothetical protein
VDHLVRGGSSPLGRIEKALLAGFLRSWAGSQPPTTRRVTGVVELLAQQREHLRTPRIVVREGFGCGLERPDAIGVNRANLAGPSSAVCQYGAKEAVRVAEFLGEPQCGRLSRWNPPDR